MRDMQRWRSEGNCADLSPEESDKYFFLDRGGSPMKTRALFCDSCPVKKLCFEYAVLYDEDGIWGGATEKERKIVAPFLKPRLKAEAQREERLEERRWEPNAPRPAYSDPIEYQLPEDLLFDMYLSSMPQTGS